MVIIIVLKRVLIIFWILVVLFNLSGVLWFIFGATANFQRGIDLISTAILLTHVIPSILLIIVSIYWLAKRYAAINEIKVSIIVILSLFMIALTPNMFKYVNTSGWLTENITADTIQMTADGKYEYQIEIVNLFQRNSTARLYVKNVESSEMKRIPLEIPVREIHGIGISKINHWINLHPKNVEDQYILKTTRDFPLSNLVFEVNLKTDKAIQIQGNNE